MVLFSVISKCLAHAGPHIRVCIQRDPSSGDFRYYFFSGGDFLNYFYKYDYV